MGACLCKTKNDHSNSDGGVYEVSHLANNVLTLNKIQQLAVAAPESQLIASTHHATRLKTIGVDVSELIAETLAFVRNLVNKLAIAIVDPSTISIVSKRRHPPCSS